MQYQRFIYLTFLLGAAVIGSTLKSAAVAVLAALGSPDTLIAGAFPLSTIIGFSGALLGFFIALRTAQAVRFVDEVWAELFKVRWPDREETQNSTLVVVVSALVLAGALALFDLTWATITERVLYTGG